MIRRPPFIRHLLFLTVVLLILGVAGVIVAGQRGVTLDRVARRVGIIGESREPRTLDDTRARLEAEGLTIPLEDPRIIVRKQERMLELLDGETGVRTYPIALGGNPIGHKERSGDGRTPEGTYYLCTRVNPSQFHLFMGISYPSPDDAQGRSEVSDSTRRAIERAWHQRESPPWNSALGGAIGIHGGGDRGDWTLGCIAVANQAVEELWLLTRLGTPVVIEP